jgi:hypothetical protein
VRLADVPPGLWLDGRTIEGCQIVGPAKIAFAGCSVDHCRFYGTTDRTFTVVEKISDHFADTIIFRNSRIEHCEFHNVTVVGTADQIAGLTTDMVEAGTS